MNLAHKDTETEYRALKWQSSHALALRNCIAVNEKKEGLQWWSARQCLKKVSFAAATMSS